MREPRNVIAVAALLMGAAAGAALLDPARVDEVFGAFTDQTPGCAAAVVRAGRTIDARGFGLADGKLRLDGGLQQHLPGLPLVSHSGAWVGYLLTINSQGSQPPRPSFHRRRSPSDEFCAACAWSGFRCNGMTHSAISATCCWRRPAW